MKRRGLFYGLVIGLILLLTLVGDGAADTPVSGPITSDTTWTLANSPYIVTGNVLVMEGVTLTIEPGVTIKFESDKALQIDGQLVAQGTEVKSIVFTSNQAPPTAGDWSYILFSDTSTDATYDGDGNYTRGSILEYCIVEYAGGATVSNNGAVRIDNSSPFINYSTVRSSASNGIIVWNTGAPKISNSTVSNNSGAGISINSSGSVIITQSTISENSDSGIDLSGSGNFTLSDSTIDSNTAIGDGGAGGISIIWATGIVNISKATISNNASHRGAGIYLSSASNVIISNSTIRNNSSSNAAGGIDVQYLTTLTISNSMIGNNSGAYGGGIHIDYGSNVDISNSIIASNSATGNGGGIAANQYYGTYIGINLIMTNTIIASNIAGSAGGGIFILLIVVVVYNQLLFPIVL